MRQCLCQWLHECASGPAFRRRRHFRLRQGRWPLGHRGVHPSKGRRHRHFLNLIEKPIEPDRRTVRLDRATPAHRGGVTFLSLIWRRVEIERLVFDGYGFYLTSSIASNSIAGAPQTIRPPIESDVHPIRLCAILPQDTVATYHCTKSLTRNLPFARDAGRGPTNNFLTRVHGRPRSNKYLLSSGRSAATTN